MDWLGSCDSIAILPKWYIGAFIGTGFILYYVREVAKLPEIACKDGKFKSFLSVNIPLLKQKFWPTLWCFESRAQTIFASILRSRCFPALTYQREILQLNDGGEVGLDWLEENCSSNSPIIIILPGLTGESQADYVKCLVLSANRIGFRTVVFNYRGLGGITLKTPRTYCACNVEDLSEVIDHVKKNHPNTPIAAAGISLGGLILGNYLAAAGDSAKNKLLAGLVISVPWNVLKGSESIEKPLLNLLLNKHLCNSLCRTIHRVRDCMEGGPWDLNDVLQSKTIREFDSKLTVKQFGFKDVYDYYTQATLHDKLNKIQVPLLCLNAADDPFQPLEAIPVDDFKECENVAIVITARGGHIGFMEGFVPAFEEEYMSRLFMQYFSAVFKDDSKFLKLESFSD